MTKRILLAMVGFAALALPLGAQTTTGTIRGDVTDNTGAPLPGVTVTVTGERGVERTVYSGDSGRYLVTAVPPGTYSIEASLAGMARQSVDAVRVTIGGSTTANFNLRPELSEEITVTSESPILDLQSSEASTNFEAEFIEDLPTRRNFWDMVALSPGMSASTEFSSRQAAFGSGTSSNSWNVDGLNVTASETGAAWWYINPETIEEIQVLGIGASAEFGNMTGAAINVVTKSGGNELSGNLNAFYQSDDLTDTNVELPDTPFPSYVRDSFENYTATLGGPIVRDKVWYFAGLEYYNDVETLPGGDPAFPATYYWERYDAKFDWALSEATKLDAKYHYEDYSYDSSADGFTEVSARGTEFGTNPAWGLGLSHVINDKNLIEFHYAGWTGDDFYHSQTGSTEDAYVDFSPPGGGPTLSSGGLAYPYDYKLETHQADVKMSSYAEDFLGGDHDFRFGIQYSYGSADTVSKAGSGGDYYGHYTYEAYYYDYDTYEYVYYDADYFYKYTWTPFHYGAKQESYSAFVQDSWSVSEEFTLNLGVRFDQHEGRIPDYERLDADGNDTGVNIPGRDDVIDWQLFSPRLGFAWTLGEKNLTVLRGSAGLYYDGNVSGNWNYPPPDAPPSLYFPCDGPPPTTCDSEPGFVIDVAQIGIDPGLDPPKSTQYALGVERQISDTMAVGVELIYRESEDLIGWEILDDGIYEEVQFVDPFTGNEYTLLNICDDGCRAPTIRKGNRPGAGSLAPENEYSSEYEAAIFTFRKRPSNGWSLQGSYTWSRSEGLIPRPRLQTQGDPFYATLSGSDPNEWINSRQILQADREHMFRLQGNVDLPWTMELTGTLNWQSGRPYNRQIDVVEILDQGRTTIIMDPNSDERRLPSVFLLDLGLGKRWKLGDRFTLKTDIQVLNVTNEDAHQFWVSQVLDEGEEYVKDSFVYPRRAMIRVGLEF